MRTKVEQDCFEVNISNLLVFNCHCGHFGKVTLQDLMLKYGGDTTVDAVEKAARCSRCRGKKITSTQIIYVGNSELAMYNSHTPKDNKDFRHPKKFGCEKVD